MNRHRRVSQLVALCVVLAACSSDASSAARPPSTPSTTPGLVTETTIRANGLNLNARTAGPADGQLVILLHGFPQSSYEWRKQMPVLARAGYHVVAPDQRGYSPGARPTADADYTMNHMVADTIAIADHFHAKMFNLVGHDWGAAVAWATAIAHPSRLRTLTAVSVPHPAAYAKASENPAGEQSQKKGYINTFAAPGADMAAALPGRGYARVRGTSFAAPLVAARLAATGSPDRLAGEAIRGKGKVGLGIVCKACRVDPKWVGAK